MPAPRSAARDTADRYDEAIVRLAIHSAHGATDDELVEGVSALYQVLHERFSEDGEVRGGVGTARALEAVGDALDDFHRERAKA